MFASAWALRDGADRPGVSEELRREHAARGDALAARLGDAPLFSWTPSRAARWGGWAAAAAFLLCLGAGARGGSLLRVLAPWRDAPLDRLVLLLPGDASLDWGASAVVAVRLTPEGAAAGLRPADLSLQTRGGDGVWRDAPWDRVDGQSASFDTGALAGPLDYRARRRDLVTSVKHLQPIIAPRFQSARAIVQGARGTKNFILGEDSPVTARRGDWVTVRAVAETRLASAALRLSNLAAPTEMRQASDGTWSTGFLAQEDATLSFVLVSAEGRRDPAPPAYALSVLGDAKPTAELLSPQVPLQAGPRDSVPITYAAHDDGAITRLELITRVGGQESRRVLPFEKGASEALGDAPLPLRSYAPGKVVDFWIEASDDASPPQTARSEKGSVEVVDVDAAHKEALASREKALEALDRAAQAAEAAAAAAKSGDEAAAKEASRPLPGRWSASANAMMAWNNALQADPRANPGLSDQAAAAAESLAEAGMQGLPKAEAALKERDLPRAAREQTALAEQARAAAAALRESAALQSAQDMAENARGAESESMDMGQALDALAALGKGSSPAELADLQKALAGVDAALEELRKSVDALPESAPETRKVRDLPLEGARQSAKDLRRALQSGDAAGAAKAARQLAQTLSNLAKGLRESGKRSASSAAGRAKESASRASKAWHEAVEAQEKAVEAARRREAARQAATLRAQKDLLRRTQDDIDSALASSPPPEAERELKSARQSLGAGKIDQTIKSLRAAGRAQAAAALERGVDGDAPDPSAAREAADAQALARGKTGSLRREVSDAAKILGYLPGGPVGRIDAALSEQETGEGALRRGDAAEGLRRGEAALAILQEGEKKSSAGEPSASGMSEAMGQPFGMQGGATRARPGGGSGGQRGTSLGHVRLPSAEDYRPPRELREELERSLREPRPAQSDAAIKEYFRRLAR